MEKESPRAAGTVIICARMEQGAIATFSDTLVYSEGEQPLYESKIHRLKRSLFLGMAGVLHSGQYIIGRIFNQLGGGETFLEVLQLLKEELGRDEFRRYLMYLYWRFGVDDALPEFILIDGKECVAVTLALKLVEVDNVECLALEEEFLGTDARAIGVGLGSDFALESIGDSHRGKDTMTSATLAVQGVLASFVKYEGKCGGDIEVMFFPPTLQTAAMIEELGATFAKEVRVVLKADTDWWSVLVDGVRSLKQQTRLYELSAWAQETGNWTGANPSDDGFEEWRVQEEAAWSEVIRENWESHESKSSRWT